MFGISSHTYDVHTFIRVTAEFDGLIAVKFRGHGREGGWSEKGNFISADDITAGGCARASVCVWGEYLCCISLTASAWATNKKNKKRGPGGEVSAHFSCCQSLIFMMVRLFIIVLRAAVFVEFKSVQIKRVNINQNYIDSTNELEPDCWTRFIFLL